MNTSKNKYSIRIPQDISLIFCKKKNILTTHGPLNKKSIKLKLKIMLDKKKRYVAVSPLLVIKSSNVEKKRINILRKTTLARIQHLFIESSATLHKKLKIVGVGFKADFATTFLRGKILILKTGLSHTTYVKVPANLYFESLKKTKFCVHGNSYNEVSQFAAILRSQKAPDPYKGKGILYENEKVILKEGKKI